MDNEIPKALINKGEKFIAGADSTGKSIFFESDYDFEVNKAQLKALKNVFLEKNTIEFGKESLEYTDKDEEPESYPGKPRPLTGGAGAYLYERPGTAAEKEPHVRSGRI